MGTFLGFASYQQQNAKEFGSPTANKTVTIVIFFSIILLLVVSFAVYFWFTEWHKISPQRRGEEQLEHQKEVDQLVLNLEHQVKATFCIPISTMLVALWKYRHNGKEDTPTSALTAVTPHPHHHRLHHHHDPLPPSRQHAKVFAHRFYHLLSLAFMICAFVALLVLVGITSQPRETQTSSAIQSSLFVFLLSINLYVITRQHFYYTERMELFGDEDALTVAVYKTRFNDWDTQLWSNWVQVLLLMAEFFQMVIFPIRDLGTILTVDGVQLTEHTPSFVRQVSAIMNAGGLMLDIRTPTWYMYSLWTAFTVMMVGIAVAALMHGVNYWRPHKLPNGWVRWCIPITTLLYMPVLTTFISSAACQSLNIPSNEYASTLRCHAPGIPSTAYFWLSLLGYVLAYFLMTLFLASYERVPRQDEIAFKSLSIAFIKNMGLLLATVFLLVESTSIQNRMRAILSIAILLTLIYYNTVTRPCYVDKINFFRTVSFSCTLWTTVLVAILTDTNAMRSLGPFSVLTIIIAGWCFIIFLYVLLYYFYYMPYETQDVHPSKPSHISTDHALVDDRPTEADEKMHAHPCGIQ